MWQLAGIVLFVFNIVSTECLLADYLKPCSRTKDFRKCAIAHGNDALPTILKGDKRFKAPNLLPLKLPKIEVDAGPNLQISLTEVDLLGLETMTLTDFKVDFEKQSVFLDLHADHLSLIGQYKVDGKILVLPVKGNGPINITTEDGQFKYTFKYKLEKKGGIDYAMIQDEDHLEFKVAVSYFKLDNLFDGNKQMGENVNKFLNENNHEVIKELGGAISGTISAIAKQVGGGFLSSLPFNEIFLP